MTKPACPAQLTGQAGISLGLQAAHLPKERQEQQGEHPRRQKGDGDMGRFPDHPFRRYEPGKHRQAQDRMEQNFSAIRFTVCRHCSASPACCQSMPPQ